MWLRCDDEGLEHDIVEWSAQSRPAQPIARVDLDVRTLRIHGGLKSSVMRTTLTAYERNGMSKERIEVVVRRTCTCCVNCYQKLSEASLVEVCEWWHGHLTAEERTFLLHSLYMDGTGSCLSREPCGSVDEDEMLAVKSHERRHQWAINGHDVCRPAFCSLIGIGHNSLEKLARGVPDVRRELGESPTHEAPQRDRVHQFFLELYMSAAESMPHDADFMVNGSADASIDDENASKDTSIATRTDATEDEDQVVDIWNPDKPLTSVIMDFVVRRPMPRRWLPHTSVTALYWLLIANCDMDESDIAASNLPASRCPSWSVFYRAWSETWSHYLKLRKSSTHAECNICWRARQRIHARNASLVERLGVAREWRRHLRDQYHDRAIYWFLRYASRRRMDVLTIIIDSMDKAKFAWPQFPWTRCSKDLESLQRPRFVFTAAIAHGFGTFFFIADESVSHGANAFCEVLLRVLEAVSAECRRSGVIFPAHLVVQSDNTTAQAKNQHVTLFLAYAVARFKFQTANIFFLVVGHTHEDIDQLFGIILQLVLRKVAFRTSRHLIDALHAIMRPRVESRHETFHAEELKRVRDFSAWLSPAGIEMYHAFGTRDDIEAPHAFSFKLRKDLTPKEQIMIPQHSRCCRDPHDHDVFCCTKTYMRSPTLQDPPLRVLPVERAGWIVAHSPQTWASHEPPSDKRAKELRELANLVRSADHGMPDAADALEELAAGSLAPPIPQTPWLIGVCLPLADVHDSGNVLFPHLPDTSWQLLVRFKRSQQ